ncbi:hypothetical protein Salat_1029300 [Sesamum alatum]|uniref:Uncharacterized protein n=1 Tax=Sesamum alatum TaxID=300844 RepID=A0AAE1YLY6_9LAMI|nr:hypothetical protein Salat_1029300 [Sesamum alatum]
MYMEEKSRGKDARIGLVVKSSATAERVFPFPSYLLSAPPRAVAPFFTSCSSVLLSLAPTLLYSDRVEKTYRGFISQMDSSVEETVPETESVAFMKLALEQAKLALDSLEVPVGLLGMQRWKQLMCCLSSGRRMDLQGKKLH